MRSIIVFFLLLACVTAYGKNGDGCNDSVFRDVDTLIINRGDNSGCLYQKSKQLITVENIINGVKDGLWLSLPSRYGTCITGQYKNGVMCGIWNIYGVNGRKLSSISNITILSDDDNFFHKALDTNGPIYIGLWTEFDGCNAVSSSYWTIFSDDFERDYIVIKRDKQIEQLLKSYNLL